jgi:hypothetical protein
MSCRKPKSRSKKPTLDCDDTCACNCAMKCPYPRCPYQCLGGHSYSPDSHWCANSHNWTAQFVPVSRYERGR